MLAEHFAAGAEPSIAILATLDTRAEADAAEREAIARLGRLGRDPGGILCNVARGGDGPDSTLMSDPEIIAKRRAFLLRYWADPENRAAEVARWARPEVRERRIKGMRGKPKTMTPEAVGARQANLKLADTPEARAAIRDELLTRWADPQYRAKRSRNQAAAWTDPEKRANMLAGRSDGIANSWKDPDVRARRIAGIKAARPAKLKQEGPGRSATMRAVNAAKTAEARAAEQRTAWADQETREKRLAGIRAAAQRPELRAARLAAMAEGKRRKAAERAALRSQTSDGDDG